MARRQPPAAAVLRHPGAAVSAREPFDAWLARSVQAALAEEAASADDAAVAADDDPTLESAVPCGWVAWAYGAVEAPADRATLAVIARAAEPDSQLARAARYLSTVARRS